MLFLEFVAIIVVVVVVIVEVPSLNMLLSLREQSGGCSLAGRPTWWWPSNSSHCRESDVACLFVRRFDEVRCSPSVLPAVERAKSADMKPAHFRAHQMELQRPM